MGPGGGGGAQPRCRSIAFPKSDYGVRATWEAFEAPERTLTPEMGPNPLVLSVDLVAGSICVEVAGVEGVAERSAGYASFVTSAAVPGGH